MRNRFFKTTKGFNAEVIVAKAVAYTDDATYDLFVVNAVEGEIGVFNANTKATLSGVLNAPAGTEIFIAQKRDALIHKTTVIRLEANVVTRSAYSAAVKQVSTVTITTPNSPVVTKGDVYELVLIDQTMVQQPFPTSNFEVYAKAGETQAALTARLAAKINDPKDGGNYYSQIATAAVSGNNIVITAKDFGTFFKVVLRQKLGEQATVATTTPYKQGVGTYDNVAGLEAEGIIFDGVTTNYPAFGLPGEYGEPTKFASASLGYNLYVLAPWQSEASPTPVDRHFHKKFQVIAVPSTGTSPNTQLGIILGVDAQP